MHRSVSFATCCWEKDWRTLLLDPTYLEERQIAPHLFPFQERILVINNVLDLPSVIRAAKEWVLSGVLTRFVVAEELADEVLAFFELKRSDFRPDRGISADWVYYNALAPLTAIYVSQSDYLLYLTGDVTLPKPCSWIPQALHAMEEGKGEVANLTWNQRYDEARRESYKRSLSFYHSKRGFSDQMFLVKKKTFRRPIYGEIHPDSHHFPRGDVFEKRVFSKMLKEGWERLTYRWGSYAHENL